MTITNEIPDIVIFFGRFHPLVVHLPIGFLLLAAILESLPLVFKGRFQHLGLATSISLLCGALGALGSVVIGYLLSRQGGYDVQTLFWHQWLGIAVGLLSFLGWAIKSGRIQLPMLYSKIVIGTLVVLIAITGHLGGNLTHGSEYLTAYAPGFVKQILGAPNDHSNLPIPSSPDSIIVFSHLVQPILEKKCRSCHGEKKANGGLRLMDRESIEKGGEDGEVIKPGKPYESELFIRSTLLKENKKFMPPKGEPLSYTELMLVEWWIDDGASFENTLKNKQIPKELTLLLKRDYDIDLQPKSYLETIQVPPLSAATFAELSAQGWRLRPLSADHVMLDVTFVSAQPKIEQFDFLLKAKDQIAWLDLNGKSVNDEMLQRIGQLSNLTVLKLHKTAVTDQGFDHLSTLSHLEVLNLYGTAATDQGLLKLKGMTNLKRIYLWQANISEDAIEELKKHQPNLEIIGGQSLKHQ